MRAGMRIQSLSSWAWSLPIVLVGVVAARPARADGLADRLRPLLGVPGGLTADGVARVAASSSPLVAERRAQLEESAARLERAKVGLAPTLILNGRYTRLSPIDQPTLGTIIAAPGAAPGPLPSGTPLVAVPLAFPVYLDQTSAQAALSVPLSDYVFRLSFGHLAAERDARAAALAVDSARRRIAAEARAAYWQWARARLDAVVAEEAVKTAAAHVADAARFVDAGSASRADLLRAQSERARAEELRQRAVAAVALAEAHLRVYLRGEAPGPLAIGEALSTDAPEAPIPADVDGLVRLALAQRPEARQLAEAIRALDAQERAAQGGYLPRLDATGEVTIANPNSRFVPQTNEWRTTWSVGLALSFSPNEAAAAHAAARATSAKRTQAIAQRAALADAIRLEVVAAVEDLRSARGSRRAAVEGLAAAEESLRVRQALYAAGRATHVELTDAETDLLRARQSAVAALVGARAAADRLRAALGE
jgi:outer membrane protein TolC